MKWKNVKTKKKLVGFRDVTKQIKNSKYFSGTLKLTLKKANTFKKKVRPARIIGIPKQGGILPTFADLSDLGALNRCIAGIAKAVDDAKAASQ